MNQLEFKIPNPDDWCDADSAASVLGRSKATVYDMTKRGVLTAYDVGRVKLWWRPEVQKVAAALLVVAARR
jgi:excisionase family DNA binding protein